MCDEKEKRKICVNVFSAMLDSVKECNEEQGFNNVGPFVVLIGEDKICPIPPEDILLYENPNMIMRNMKDICSHTGKIIGLCSGNHVCYTVPSGLEVNGCMVYEQKDYYSIVNVILGNNDCSPSERTLVLFDDGSVHHVDKMAFQEPFQDEIRKMKSLSNCVSCYNIGFNAAMSAAE